MKEDLVFCTDFIINILQSLILSKGEDDSQVLSYLFLLRNILEHSNIPTVIRK
jgi:hypothetical protein